MTASNSILVDAWHLEGRQAVPAPATSALLYGRSFSNHLQPYCSETKLVVPHMGNWERHLAPNPWHLEAVRPLLGMSQASKSPLI